MLKKVHVIINPAAGQDRPVLGIINKAFQEVGAKWSVDVTNKPGDAIRLTKQAVAAGADCVAVHGGDGTVMEVANGLLGTNVPMAILPGGTANVMSVELGIPSDVGQAAALINDTDHSMIRSVDVGQIGDRHFMLRVGMGWEAQMVDGADKEIKARAGTLAYLISGLQALRDPQIARYQLTIDGKEIEVEGMTCMIANSGNVGTPGIRVAQNVDVSDGLLDVIVIRKADLGSLISVVASVVAGNENAEPLQHWQGRNIKVVADPPQTVQADGEILGQTPVDISVIPNALKIIVPKPKEAAEPIRRENTENLPGMFGTAVTA
jgi:diacylglycerol kinase (ATP)